MRKCTRNGGLALGQKLSQYKLAAMTAYLALMDGPPKLAIALAQENNDTLVKFYKKSRSYDHGETLKKMDQADNKFLLDIKF